MRPSDCPHPYDLQSLADGHLCPQEEEQVRRHLAECPSCAERMEELERLLPLLRAGRVPVPAGLRGRVLDAVALAPPVRPLTCRQAGQMVSAYLDEELDDLETQALEAHLFACEACYRQYVHLRATCAGLRGTPRAVASPDLKDRILAAVASDAATEPVLGVITPAPSAVMFRRRLAASVAAVAAIALMAFGVFQMNTEQQKERARVAVTLPEEPAPAPGSVGATVEPEAEPVTPSSVVDGPVHEEEAPQAAPAPTTPPAREIRDARPEGSSPAAPRQAPAPSRPQPSRAVASQPPAPAAGATTPVPARTAEAARPAAPPTTVDERPASRLAATDRTQPRAPRPATPGMEVGMPGPPRPETATAPAGGVRTGPEVAHPPVLTRPEPLIAAPQPAPEVPRVATAARPALDDMTARRVTERNPADGSSVRVYTARPDAAGTDLAERNAAINAEAGRDRRRALPETW